MTNRPQRRWLPAFSIRTLLVVMTLLCGYAACWWPTKTQGGRDVTQHLVNRLEIAMDDDPINLAYPFGEASAIVPLVVRQNVMYMDATGPRLSQRHYFWFFGYAAKLPYERSTEKLPLRYPRFP